MQASSQEQPCTDNAEADRWPCGISQDDPRYQVADPICTFVFALLVLLTTRVILSDISDVLMERVPRSLDVAIISEALCAVRSCFHKPWCCCCFCTFRG